MTERGFHPHPGPLPEGEGEFEFTLTPALSLRERGKSEFTLTPTLSLRERGKGGPVLVGKGGRASARSICPLSLRERVRVRGKLNQNYPNTTCAQRARPAVTDPKSSPPAIGMPGSFSASARLISGERALPPVR